MTTTKKQTSAEPMDAVLRFRVAGSLKERFEKLAAQQGRKPSDLARIVFSKFVASKGPKPA